MAIELVRQVHGSLYAGVLAGARSGTERVGEILRYTVVESAAAGDETAETILALEGSDPDDSSLARSVIATEAGRIFRARAVDDGTLDEYDRASTESMRAFMESIDRIVAFRCLADHRPQPDDRQIDDRQLSDRRSRSIAPKDTEPT